MYLAGMLTRHRLPPVPSEYTGADDGCFHASNGRWVSVIFLRSGQETWERQLTEKKRAGRRGLHRHRGGQYGRLRLLLVSCSGGTSAAISPSCLES